MSAADFEIIDDLFCFDDKALFMKAYFDESGKQGWAPVISIFGLLMSARTCKELQRRWFREAAKLPAIPLPFHMSDCVSGSKSFKHLQEDEPARWQMQERMIKTMRGLDMQVYGSAVIRSDYETVKEKLRSNPEYRDPWYLVFETGIQEMMFRSADAGKNHRISLVFDRMDKGFSKRAHSLYDELLTIKGKHIDRLGGLTFDAKDKIAALQAIDVITYESTRFIAEHIRLGLPKRWQAELLETCLPPMPPPGIIYEKRRLAELVRLVKLDRAGRTVG